MWRATLVTFTVASRASTSVAFVVICDCNAVSAEANSVRMSARSVCAVDVNPAMAEVNVPSPLSHAVRNSVIWSKLVPTSRRVSSRVFSADTAAALL